MKTRRLLLLLALLMTLCACSRQTSEAANSSRIDFYYRCDVQNYDGKVTALDTQSYVCQTDSIARLLADYFAGPGEDDLFSPFPRGTSVVDLYQDGTLLTVRLSRSYDGMDGVEKTLADACLTLTLTQLDGVERVCLLGEDQAADPEFPGYAAEDFVLLDTGSLVSEQSLKLYFADENDRYLLTELRQVIPTDPATEAEYLVNQLIAGPREADRYPAIPNETSLLGIAVSDGLCTVNFSAAFLDDRPHTEAGEWMTVYSVVNTLTQLEDIDQVLLLCQGETIPYYRYMRLDQPLRALESLEGPVRYNMNEYDATIYLGSWSRDYLAALPVRLRQTMAYSLEELLLQTMQEYQAPVGYEILLPEGTRVLSVDTTDGCCYLDLSQEFARDQEDSASQRLRINALVASLCSLPDVEAVQLSVEGQNPVMGPYDLSGPITVSEDWFYP